MHRSFRRLLASLLLLVLLGAAARAETMRLRADVWMPYNGEPDAALPGYAIEIARTILGPHDITLDYRTMPWGDALKAVAAGEIDAIVGANREEAEGLVLPEERIGLPRVGLFVRRDNTWRYDNIASLRTVRLGAIVDYKYWPTFDDYIAKHGAPNVILFSGENPLEDALAQLKEGKVDVVAETAPVFAWTAKSAGFASSDFRLVYLHEGDPVFFAFTPHGEAGRRYARLFDEGLRELRRTGRLADILARYGQKDWQ